MSKIYKKSDSKEKIMHLYDEKLNTLQVELNHIDVLTNFGNTRVVVAGNHGGKKIILFHGFNAGAPITLDPIKDLCSDYCFYVIETVGQTTKSDETKMDIKNLDFGAWADEVIMKLGFESVPIVGISYGGFILQKLMQFNPKRIEKCMFLVPGGISSGYFGESMKKLTFPLLRWKLSKKDDHLNKFISAFAPKNDEFMFRFLRNIMKETNLDTRIPPLLKPEQVQDYQGDVFMMVAENDVHFPGAKILEKSKILFPTLLESYVLKGSNHMPGKEHYPIIQQKLVQWLG